MRRIRPLYLLLALPIIAVACATSTQTETSPLATNGDGRGFENILVIGVADDYNGRARFERDLATELKTRGTRATAYYSAVGGNKPIERKTIEELVASEGFDAVLITKVLNRDTQSSVKTGSTTVRATRKEGRAIDLFRYEYEELNEPATLDINFTVTISSELFAASDGDKVWDLEARISDKKMISEIVDEAVTTIIRRLRKDGFVD